VLVRFDGLGTVRAQFRGSFTAPSSQGRGPHFFGDASPTRIERRSAERDRTRHAKTARRELIESPSALRPRGLNATLRSTHVYLSRVPSQVLSRSRKFSHCARTVPRTLTRIYAAPNIHSASGARTGDLRPRAHPRAIRNGGGRSPPPVDPTRATINSPRF
jgi:hypothetical protein